MNMNSLRSGYQGSAPGVAPQSNLGASLGSSINLGPVQGQAHVQLTGVLVLVLLTALVVTHFSLKRG